MLVDVSWLEVSISFAFFCFKSFFGEHSTHYSKAYILEPIHLPKEVKKAKFPHNTMKGGDLQSHLVECYAFLYKKYSSMLSNLN